MRKGSENKCRINFHSTYFIVAMGFILTGEYCSLIVFTSLILVHEFGHFLVARVFGVKVLSINIYPFGGVTKLDSYINLSIIYELLIAMAGVLMQYTFYLVICFLNHLSIVRDYVMDLYTFYNREMIFFNLLPMIPLDGSKILSCILDMVLPYRIVNYIMVGISILFLVIFIVFDIYVFNYSFMMMVMLLFTYLVKFIFHIKDYYYRFLLERYLIDFDYSYVKVIFNYKNMYRDRKHVIVNDGKIYKERDFIRYLFSRDMV